MTPSIMLEIFDQALIVVVKISMPILLIGLVVGVAISILQALTQIQENTLTFVPKLVAVFTALAFLMPYMITTLMNFSTELFNRIVQG